MNTTRIYKKSLNIKNRIQKLENRNLILDDSKMLYDFLKKKTTYYHLTSYRFLLDNYDKAMDNYNNHRSNELIALYELDKDLSFLFFKEIRTIEQSLRAHIANLCHENDGVTFKLDETSKTVTLEENYCKNDNRIKFIADTNFNKNISKQLFDDIYKMKEDPAIKHHLNDYQKIIPLWVIINYVSFGTLVRLIECFTTAKLNEFMKGKSYKKATSAFDPCRTYLKAIQMLRNKISHHSNILGKKSPYHVKGNSYSIYFIGYYDISAWTSFLLNDSNTSIRLKKEVKNTIRKINRTYNTTFDFSTFMCKNIK